MDIVFDPEKDKANVAKHGISLAKAKEFDLGSAYYRPDHRKDYGEMRIIALGDINSRLHNMVFVIRDGECRIISLRKANKRERGIYEKRR